MEHSRQKKIFRWQPWGVGVRESVGITTVLDIEQDRMELYRSLLAPRLEVPPRPQLMFYVYQFRRVFPWPLRGYREAAVCARAVGPGGTAGWRALHMAVSSVTAWCSGVAVGYPKYIARSLVLEPAGGGWLGSIKTGEGSPFSLEFSPGDIEVWWKGTYNLSDTFLLTLPWSYDINMMELSIHEQRRMGETDGEVKITVGSLEPWADLLTERVLASPGTLHEFSGRGYLTRRGLRPI